MMEQLKTTIQHVISESKSINWLIVHAIAKLCPTIENVEFSFVDGKERDDEPFKTNQGYLSLKTPKTIKSFEKIVSELIQLFETDEIALANLHIVVSRTSYSGEDRDILAKNYKNNLKPETLKKIYILLVNSLNEVYHQHNYIARHRPKTTDDWLRLFHSTQYLHVISDPLINCLLLVKKTGERLLDFELIELMHPALRAVLMGWYGYDLCISEEKLDGLLQKKEEAAFLSACLIDDTAPDKKAPEWLSKKVIELFVNDHWINVGHPIFVHVLGLSFRNKNDNELYKRLAELFHIVLSEKLLIENHGAIDWIHQLKFPDDFIALFAWSQNNNLKLSDIPENNRAAVLNQFINELRVILDNIPEYLSSENSKDPFISYNLYEPKYQNAIAHLLILLLYATEANMKELERICFSIKLLFYGGYSARSLAIHFTEFLLLIGISARNLNGMEENEFETLQTYLTLLVNTILVPYVHLTERNDEIWNPDSTKNEFQYNAGRYMINLGLSEIRKHEINVHFEGFFKAMDNIKIAEWPYERIMKEQQNTD